MNERGLKIHTVTTGDSAANGRWLVAGILALVGDTWALRDSHLIKTTKIGILYLSLLALSACGSTRQFVDSPPLEVRGSTTSVSHALSQMFVDRLMPYEIALCEADPATRQCNNENSFPSATGLGGLFLPLVMDLESITVEQATEVNGSITLETKLSAPVNQRPSSCGKVTGRIEASTATAALRFPNNYCNWMIVGNVVQSAVLAIDAVDLETESFSGYYKISFYGTGNARGSGYFRAEITALPQELNSDPS